MRIGFDTSQTGRNKAGCGYMAHALIDHLSQIDTQNHYLLYSNFGPDFWDPDHGRGTFNRRAPHLERRFAAFSRRQAEAFWSSSTATLEAELGHPDIIHSNNYYCPPELGHARLIYTLYDLAFLTHPEYTTESNRLVCFRGVFAAALRADAIIAISVFTRNHFLELFPHFPPERVHVIYGASRFSGAARGGEPKGRLAGLIPGGFWLFVGTLEPRKNLRRLLQAYAGLRRDKQTALPLVIAGGRGWLEEGLEAYIATLGVAEDVYLLGYIDDGQLGWLYRHCFAFVYPSLFEGFGLPVVEAMSLGAAVITANSTSLPEVCGDAALMVDPRDSTALATAMQRLEADTHLQNDLRQRARERAARFSWQTAAEQVLALYRRLGAS